MDLNSPILLLAEDSPADVYIVQRSLRQHLRSFELQVVDDGEKAIRMIEAMDADDAAPCPSILILDLNLPKRSGQEILQCLRRSRRCSRIPVVVLTASDSPADQAAIAKYGATAYFCKPIELDQFMELGRIVKDALALSTGETAGSGQAIP
jgi:two-component system, chemotaxis family, response regulator Rcp1